MKVYTVTVYLEDRTLSGIKFWRREDVDSFLSCLFKASNYQNFDVEEKNE